ncbi:golgin subfamily A member 1 isoform X1 [Anastrepha obliqua]|uniref:golgin subfamily A member 1 isoform X1 n=1 Tax=Anastrepha obliqua TaxID=95512 RepID=UPI002409F2E4|nr:golgin subfamily A member 1 isoform X1 [Anastrepha obliqua]
MFASLKNKIKEETGSDVATTAQNTRHTNHNNNRIRSRFSSTLSVNSTNEDNGGGGSIDSQSHVNEQLSALRSQCNELTTKVTDLNSRLQMLQEEKTRIEKTNEILLETVKVAQTQKDIYCEEQEKIQNLQQSEIEKLKNLLSFREQEAVDRLAAMRQNQQQIENLTTELERLKQYEPMVEDLQDELERLRHSSQLGKNNLTTTLAAVEEENRHLKMRLQIMEQARLDAINSFSADEKMQALVQERKMLEQHLEEAHLQLSDIKSTWSGQNLSLETQVSRLSKQVAEETTEKRKALRMRDDLNEKVKQLEFEMMKLKDDMKQREDKIKLLEEEIDELNLALKECREESEQQVVYERNKAETLENETKDLKLRITTADERFSEYATNAEHVALSLRQQNAQLQEQLTEAQNLLETEKEEKLTALLRNAEISQSEEILRKELRIERDEANDLHEKNEHLTEENEAKAQEIKQCQIEMEELKTVMYKNDEKLKEIDELQREISEKNKTIKILNQRLADLKKTLHKEFRSAKSFEVEKEGNGSYMAVKSMSATNALAANNTILLSESLACEHCGTNTTTASTTSTSGTSSIVMDEVNFKYLKHVIVKFLTSREVEARHLTRAVATLLRLTKDEEKLLQDTLNWKMSWFGSKPNHGRGQHSFSIPPS